MIQLLQKIQIKIGMVEKIKLYNFKFIFKKWFILFKLDVFVDDCFLFSQQIIRSLEFPVWPIFIPEMFRNQFLVDKVFSVMILKWLIKYPNIN